MEATERMTRGDLRLVVITLLIIAGSVWYTWSNYTAAFPEASIDLKLSKEEITQRAEAFARQQQLQPEKFRNVTLFDIDDDARLYLEREAGLEEANSLMRTRVSVWRWRARWFQPPNKEEFTVYLSPDGRLVGFEHEIPEEQAAPRLTSEEARAVAEQFLKRHTDQPSKLIEEKVEARPNRDDHFFTWEDDGFRAKEATYRRRIVVQGAQVGSYREFLHVPEQWKRDFAAMRSQNELYTQIAQAFYLPLILGAIVVLIQQLRRHTVRVRDIIPIPLFVAVLMVLNQWNMLPFFVDAMPTSSSFPETLLIGVLQALGAGVAAFLYIALAGGAGQPLYQAQQPAMLRLPQAFSGRGIRTREFFRSTVIGYGFAAAHIAFVTAFYLLGRKFGVWSPQDVPYSDLLSTPLPWLYPLAISMFAGVSEEFYFRLLAIPLLRKLLRSTWLAVLIPAFVWGFLHANYPQQPAYVRGLEVGVIGVVAGFIMLRYGIIATLVWHYTVDAVLIGLFLVQAEGMYFKASGLIVSGAVLFPLLVSLAAYARKGGFARTPDLTGVPGAAEAGSGVEVVEEASLAPREEPVARLEFRRWPFRWLAVGGAAGAVALLLCKPIVYGDFNALTVERTEAAATSASLLAQRGVDPPGWQQVTVFTENQSVDEFEYLRQQVGGRRANELMERYSQSAAWMTRFFKPLQKEEWRVWLGPQGQTMRMDHLLDEKAPGANLSPEEARQRAEAFLGRHAGADAERLKLVDSGAEKRDNRTDHRFVWEDPEAKAGEAQARISLTVQGDEISGFRRFWKLPEAWQRDFDRPRIQAFLVPGLIGALCFPLLILALKRIATRGAHYFHWRVYLQAGITALALLILGQLNQWPVLLGGYDTAEPQSNYLLQALLGRVVMVTLLGLGVFAGAMAIDVFAQLAFGRRTPEKPDGKRAAAIVLLFGGLGQFTAMVGDWIPGQRHALNLWTAGGVDTLVPAISALSRSFVSAFGVALMLGVGVCVVLKFVRPSWRVPLAAAAALAVGIGSAESLGMFGHAALSLVLALAALVLVVRVCGYDLYTYLAAVWLLAAIPAGLRLLEQPNTFFRANGLAALVVALAAGAWLVTRTPPAPTQEPEPASTPLGAA